MCQFVTSFFLLQPYIPMVSYGPRSAVILIEYKLRKSLQDYFISINLAIVVFVTCYHKLAYLDFSKFQKKNMAHGKIFFYCFLPIFALWTLKLSIRLP